MEWLYTIGSEEAIKMKRIIKVVVFTTMLFVILSDKKVSAEEGSKFIIKDGALTSYIGTEENLMIPDGVTMINDFVFRNNHIIKTVEFPDTLVWVGTGAFEGCKNLEKVTMKDSVTHIDPVAFYGCEQLEDVTISNGLQWIEHDAFSATPWLEKMMTEHPMLIVNNMLISGYTFEGKVKIPDGVVTIAPNAFAYARISEVTIPSSVKTIGAGAFVGCRGLTKVTMSDSVTELGQDAFEGCYNLKTVRLSKSLSRIELGVFSDCKKLESLEIPDSVNEIGWAFSQCKKLKKIVIPKSVKKINSDIFYQCSKSLSIYGEKGSFAEKYAKKYKYPFQQIEALKSEATGKTATYKVKSGDTLWKIAGKMLGNSTRYKEIMKLSNLKSTELKVGQILTIPINRK